MTKPIVKNKTSASEESLFELILASSIHDMKNSVGLLLGKLDLLSDSTQKQNHNNNNVYELKYHGTQIKNKLAQLLTLYRLQNKQYFLDINEHYVKEYLDEIINPMRAIVNSEIQLQILCSKELYGFFDSELVASLVYNVLNNAYRYAKSKIEIVAALGENKQLIITISDDGPGYPEQMLKQPYTGQTKISYQSGNTGMGLYFSSLVAEMHVNKETCGYISLNNRGINGGGRFMLVLP